MDLRDTIRRRPAGLGHSLLLVVAGAMLWAAVADAQDSAPQTEAVVSAEAANVMSGTTVIGRLTRGQRVTIQKTNNDWYLIALPGDQRGKSGWIHRNNVEFKPIAPPAPAGTAPDPSSAFNLGGTSHTPQRQAGPLLLQTPPPTGGVDRRPPSYVSRDLQVPEIILPTGHLGTVARSCRSRTGERIATGDSAGVVILWDAATGQKLRSFSTLNHYVVDCDFDRDDKRLLVASAAGVIDIWEIESGAPVVRIFNWSDVEGTIDGVSSARYSPDGTRIVSSDRGGKLKIWNASDGTLLASKQLSPFPLAPARWSPDGSRIAVGTIADDPEVLVLDSKLTAIALRLRGHGGNVQSVEWSAAGDKLASTDASQAIVWDATSGEVVHRKIWQAETIRHAAFAGERVAVVIDHAIDGLEVALLSADLRQVVRKLAVADHTASESLRAVQIAYATADGRKFTLPAAQLAALRLQPGTDVAMLGAGVGCHLLDLAGQDEPRRIGGGEFSRLNLQSSPGGDVIFGSQLAAGVWDLAQGRHREFKSDGVETQLHQVAAVGRQQRLISVGRNDGVVAVWDRTSGRLLHQIEPAFVRKHDGKSLIRGDWDSPVVSPAGRFSTNAYYDVNDDEFSRNSVMELTDLETGQVVAYAPLNVDLGNVTGRDRAMLTDDGVLIGQDPASLKIVAWDLKGRKSLREWVVPGETFVGGCSLAAAGRRFVVRLPGKQLSDPALFVVYDLEHEAPRLTFQSSAAAADILADGRQILVGDAKHGFLIDVDAATASRFVDVQALAASPDGKRLAIGHGVNIALTNRQSGEREHHIALSGRIQELKFSSDGSRLFAAVQDGFTSIIDVASGGELGRLAVVAKGTQTEWIVATANGMFDGSPGGRQSIAYRVGGGLTVAPVDRFFHDFYSPGLLAALWKGESPEPAVTLGAALPPKIRIVSPADHLETAERSVTVEVEVLDQGGGFSGPWLRHNGARVRAVAEPRREPGRLLQTFDLQLVEGENRLRLEASSGDGSWEAEPAKLTIRLTADLAKPDLYVLAAGVNEYAEAAMNLQFAVADVEAVAAVFQTRGASLYENVRVKKLVNADATRTRLREALREIADVARPQDTLLVYLSGHGFTIGQRYYFIPHEFANKSRRFEDDVREYGYPSDELAEAMGDIPALKRVFVLDTCNSGGAIGDTRHRNPFAFRGAIERLSRAQGIFTIAASSASEDAVEIQELGHGVLTYSLLAALSATDKGPLVGKPLGRDGDPSRVATVLDWFNYANEQVPQLTKHYLGQPQDVKLSGEGTSFPILPLGME